MGPMLSVYMYMIVPQLRNYFFEEIINKPHRNEIQTSDKRWAYYDRCTFPHPPSPSTPRPQDDSPYEIQLQVITSQWPATDDINSLFN